MQGKIYRNKLQNNLNNCQTKLNRIVSQPNLSATIRKQKISPQNDHNIEGKQYDEYMRQDHKKAKFEINYNSQQKFAQNIDEYQQKNVLDKVLQIHKKMQQKNLQNAKIYQNKILYLQSMINDKDNIINQLKKALKQKQSMIENMQQVINNYQFGEGNSDDQ